MPGCSCDTLGEALPKLIPFLVASLCDVLPAVKAHGLAATHHVALTALPSVLLPFAPLLRHHVARIARGAPRRLWPLAAAATVSLAVSESRGDPRHESLEEAAWFLMDEAERHSHDPERRLVAAWALPPLCASAGLISLRFLSRALPLALEWAAAADLPSVCGGLAVVATVVRVGWPRVRRRGAAVWASLLRAADALATVRRRDLTSRPCPWIPAPSATRASSFAPALLQGPASCNRSRSSHPNRPQLHGVPRTASTEWRSAEAQAYGAARPVYQSDAEELERAWDGIVAVGALLWLTGDAKAREALEAGVREGGARGAVSRLSVEAGIELERGAP